MSYEIFIIPKTKQEKMRADLRNKQKPNESKPYQKPPHHYLVSKGASE